MTEQLPPSRPETSSPSSWFGTWIAAVTKPNPQTYADIANSPAASPGKAYLWVFLAGLLNALVGVLAQGSLIERTLQSSGLSNTSGIAVSLTTLLCSVPFFAVVVVIMFAIWVAVVQLVAHMFSGQGTYNQLLYAASAIYVPVAVASSVLSLLGLIPFVGFCFGILGFALAIYSLVLNIMAVKGVNGFGYGAAIGSVLIPAAVFFLIVFCCVLVIALALGSAIGNIFSTINQSLGGF
jgi:hypothetical protein